MAIMYYEPFMDEFRIQVVDVPFEYECGEDWYPNECFWIVPGTWED